MCVCTIKLSGVIISSNSSDFSGIIRKIFLYAVESSVANSLKRCCKCPQLFCSGHPLPSPLSFFISSKFVQHFLVPF